MPLAAELHAPPSWRAVDFISDLHLQLKQPATFEAWRGYMASTPADAVFILGDLFEAWVGDDCVGHIPPQFEDSCAEVLSSAGQRLALYFMHGNRDFLVGQALIRRCHAKLLDDPTVLSWGGQRWLLSHGDALCTGDTDYLKFRQLVRSPGWQDAFLAKTLAERQAIARSLRQQSESRKKSGVTDADVDADTARQWLQMADAPCLIHGHTHRPAEHELGHGLCRIVLSDWDLSALPPRAQVLRLSAASWQRMELAAG